MSLRAVFFVLFVAIFPNVALAQSVEGSDQPTANTVPVSWLVTHQPSLVRRLATRGFSFDGLIINDWSKGFCNDGEGPEGFGRDSVDLFLRIDGEKIGGWKGASGLVRLKNHAEQFGGTSNGGAQVYSNIDSPSYTTLYELWVEQRMYGDKLRVKAGKIDSNTEFAVVESAGDFLNSSMGFSPTIVAFPSYPSPRLGLGVFTTPTNNSGLALGVFQTSGMGTLALAEPSRRWDIGESELAGRLSLGYWRLDGTMDRFEGTRSTTTQGLYSVAEQALWRQPFGNDGNEKKLSSFLQLGMADGQVSSITHHLGMGTVLQSPFMSRPHDAFGVATTIVRFSSSPDAAFDCGHELVFETYYKFNISRQISFVQDFQFLHHPGGLQSNPDYPVITPRLILSF
jgi:carbohydrate-selective porin OprB